MLQLHSTNSHRLYYHLVQSILWYSLLFLLWLLFSLGMLYFLNLGGFFRYLLLPFSNLIPLWSKNILCMISVSWYLLRLVLCLKIWFILIVSFPYENNSNSLLVRWSNLCQWVKLFDSIAWFFLYSYSYPVYFSVSY